MIDWRVPHGCSRLILVRHAEPDDAVRGRCYGSLDIGLSPTGVAQAKRVVAELANTSIDAAYSSPRIRATQTIAALPVPTTVVPDLREIDFGAFEGMTYEDAEAKHPDIYRCWMETPTEVAFPGGERYADVKRRVRDAAARIRATHAGGCALLVAHGGTIRSLLAEALRMADEDLFRIDIAHASISVLDAFPDGTPIVRLMNHQS
jgi:broad specificity phosphatase PhoE